MAKKKNPPRPIPAPASRTGSLAGAKTVADGKTVGGTPATAPYFSSAWLRETVEAIVTAFVLAFLFRGFVAEAFVIPTGSMAPTLMGQHKDIACPECGYRYRVSASSESDDRPPGAGQQIVVRDVIAATCPMCRYTLGVDPRTPEGRANPTYGGDRIVATKFTYELGEPHRWDVFIFKYPGEAQTNYIKRLVGLPGESLRLWHGDLYVKPDGEPSFQLERRAADKVRAMAQIVYDNDYVVDSMTEKGWPLRWEAAAALGSTGKTWTTGDGGRSFEIEAPGESPQWLRYRHFVPTLDDWERMDNSPLPAGYRPKPQLITDFYAYNTNIPRGFPVDQASTLGLHWVGDLLLECQVDTSGNPDGGKVLLDLVKGGRHFGCELDLVSGTAQLSIAGVSDYHPQAARALAGQGQHRLEFANVDNQLLLWIDGSPVVFDTPTTYEALGNDTPESTADDPLDLAPAGIAAVGAKVRASGLRLKRDIYYIAARENIVADYPDGGTIASMSYQQLVEFWSTPTMWKPATGPHPFDERVETIFSLGPDQFFALGDNSPQSKDARLWEGEKFVSRDLLVGKALFIFWPHALNHIPGTGIPFPMFPNFARMGFIR